MANLENTSYRAVINYAKNPRDTPCKCGNCDHKCSASKLREIEDCSLTPGDPSPAGRCPKCDSLAYVESDKT